MELPLGPHHNRRRDTHRRRNNLQPQPQILTFPSFFQRARVAENNEVVVTIDFLVLSDNLN